MKTSPHLSRILFTAGIVMLFGGIFDPLEGSLVILAGGILLTLSLFLKNDAFRKSILLSTLSIATGVLLMFYFSSLGGFGGDSALSWWWGLLILPYPVGWLLTIILLIIRLMKQKKARSEAGFHSNDQ